MSPPTAIDPEAQEFKELVLDTTPGLNDASPDEIRDILTKCLQPYVDAMRVNEPISLTIIQQMKCKTAQMIRGLKCKAKICLDRTPEHIELRIEVTPESA